MVRITNALEEWSNDIKRLINENRWKEAHRVMLRAKANTLTLILECYSWVAKQQENMQKYKSNLFYHLLFEKTIAWQNTLRAYGLDFEDLFNIKQHLQDIRKYQLPADNTFYSKRYTFLLTILKESINNFENLTKDFEKKILEKTHFEENRTSLSILISDFKIGNPIGVRSQYRNISGDEYAINHILRDLDLKEIDNKSLIIDGLFYYFLLNPSEKTVKYFEDLTEYIEKAKNRYITMNIVNLSPQDGILYNIVNNFQNMKQRIAEDSNTIRVNDEKMYGEVERLLESIKRQIEEIESILKKLI